MGINYGLDVIFEQFFSNCIFYILLGLFFSFIYEVFNGEIYSICFDNIFVISFMGGREWLIGQWGIIQGSVWLMYNGGQCILLVLSLVCDFNDFLNLILDEVNFYSICVDNFFCLDLCFVYCYDNEKNVWYILFDVQNFIFC